METPFSAFHTSGSSFLPSEETKGQLPFETSQLSFGFAPFDSPSLSFAPSSISPGLFPPQNELVWRSVQPQDIETLGSNDVWRSVNPNSGYDFISAVGPTVHEDLSALPILGGRPSFSSLAIDPKRQETAFSSYPSSPSNVAAAKTDLQSINDQVTPDPPYPPGGYLEPSYHFISQTRPLTLLQSVLQFLEEQLVDCTAKYDKYKVSCMAYKEGGRLHFTIRIFSIAQGKLAIEFQRREGCVMHFNEIYRCGKEMLHSKQLVEVEDLPPASNAEKCPLSPPTWVASPASASSSDSESDTSSHAGKGIKPLQDPTGDQVRETLRCLLSQATSSDYLDVKIGALSALARLACTGCDIVAEVLVTDGAVEALVADLYSPIEDIYRCAATALAKLTAKKDGVCLRIAKAGGVKKLTELARSAVPEVVRECAQALAKIGSQLGARVVDDNFKKALEHCRCSPDPRAREHVAGLMETLKV